MDRWYLHSWDNYFEEDISGIIDNSLSLWLDEDEVKCVKESWEEEEIYEEYKVEAKVEEYEIEEYFKTRHCPGCGRIRKGAKYPARDKKKLPNHEIFLLLKGDKEMRKKHGTLVPTGENLSIPIRRKKPKAKKAEKSVSDNKEIINTPGVLIISTGPEPRKKAKKPKPMPIRKRPKPLQLHSWPILGEKKLLRVKTMPLPRKSMFRNLTKPKGMKIPENNIMRCKHRALITTITREHTTKPVPNNNKPGTSVPEKKEMTNETEPPIITTEENLTKPVTKKKAKKNKLEKSVPGNKEMINKPGSLINTTEENMTKPVTKKKAKKNKLEKIETEKKEITNKTGPPIITTEENLTKPVTKKKAKKNKLEKSVPNNKEIINRPGVLIISTEPEPRKKAKKQKQLLCENKEMINTPRSLFTATAGNLEKPLTRKEKKIKNQNLLESKKMINTPGSLTTAAGENLEKPLTMKQARKIKNQNRLPFMLPRYWSCPHSEIKMPQLGNEFSEEQFKLKWPKLNEATSFRVKTKRFPRTSLFKKMKKPRGMKTPERFIRIPLRWKISPYGGKPKQTQEEIDLMKKQKKEGKELQMVTDLLDKFFGNKRELIERQVIKKGIRKQEVNDKHAQWARSAKKRFSVFSSINNL